MTAVSFRISVGSGPKVYPRAACVHIHFEVAHHYDIFFSCLSVWRSSTFYRGEPTWKLGHSSNGWAPGRLFLQFPFSSEAARVLVYQGDITKLRRPGMNVDEQTPAGDSGRRYRCLLSRDPLRLSRYSASSCGTCSRKRAARRQASGRGDRPAVRAQSGATSDHLPHRGWSRASIHSTSTALSFRSLLRDKALGFRLC